MSTIRRLTPITTDSRRFARLSDPKQRAQLLDHVLCSLIQRQSETDAEFQARATTEVDRMTIQWRTFSDLEMRSRQRVMYISDYDPIAHVWEGR